MHLVCLGRTLTNGLVQCRIVVEETCGAVPTEQLVKLLDKAALGNLLRTLHMAAVHVYSEAIFCIGHRLYAGPPWHGK